MAHSAMHLSLDLERDSDHSTSTHFPFLPSTLYSLLPHHLFALVLEGEVSKTDLEDGSMSGIL
jgi:hypothetical protein